MNEPTKILAEEVHKITTEHFSKYLYHAHLVIKTSYDFWYELLQCQPDTYFHLTFPVDKPCNWKFMGYEIYPDYEVKDKPFIIEVLNKPKPGSLSWEDLPFNRSPDGKHS